MAPDDAFAADHDEACEISEADQIAELRDALAELAHDYDVLKAQWRAVNTLNLKLQNEQPQTPRSHTVAYPEMLQRKRSSLTESCEI